jgi:hypothetical protein
MKLNACPFINFIFARGPMGFWNFSQQSCQPMKALQDDGTPQEKMSEYQQDSCLRKSYFYNIQMERL